MVDVSKTELKLLLNAFESVQAEMEQLTMDAEWFVSDTVDLVASGVEIVRGHLGLHPITEEDEDNYE